MTDSADAWHVVGWLGPLAFLAALALSSLLIALLMPLFRRFALAVPNSRSSHKAVTPQGGGAGVLAGTFGATGLAVLASPQLAAATGGGLWLALSGALLLALVGAVDDARHLGAIPKLFAQTVAVILIIAALPSEMHICPVLPHALERALLFVGGLWFVNLVNFMDGIDWMMVAEVVPVTGGVALIGALGALPAEGLLVALALNGAMLGFAPFNRPVARLFLGDVGSLPTGLLLLWLLYLVAGAGHLAAALLLPLYFIADASLTLARRLRAGERVWEAHRTHFYQQAGDNGFSTLEIVGRVFAVNCGLVALAALSVVMASPAVSMLALALGAALVAWLIRRFARRRA